LKEESLPGRKDTFVLDTASPLSAMQLKRQFHTSLAKLLYLSRQARPDIITMVGFLCTRVQAPTNQNSEKLQQLLGYQKKTAKRTLFLRP
jgi:hypothetical protein